LPVKIGIKKGKDKFAEPLSKSTPEMEKLTEFIDGVIKGEIPVQAEDIESGEIIQGLDTDASTREFYDVIQNAINNNETKTKQSPSNYVYDPMVERVQIGLKFLGFDLPIHGADGLYGPETARSVSDFKQKYNVAGEGSVMDLAFLSSLIARLRENGFSRKDLSKVVQGSQDMAGSDVIIGDTSLGDGETSWVYWLSHNQGSAGAAELLKVALGSKPEFSSNGKQWFMRGWEGKSNHIKGNVGNRGWDGEYKTRIKAAYDQGNDQLVAKLFTEYQKKKFDQMLERGRRDLPKHPEIKAILQKYANVFPLDFLAAVASQESGFNPRSGNNKYKGLFALDPNSGYGKKYGLTAANVHDPEKNAEVAVKFWNDNRKEFNSYMSSNELAALGLNRSSSNMA
jgi:peptidoglycan hydrolase-like protein with peptidoglycan-binding domain